MRIGIDGRYIQDHFPGIGRYTYHLARNLAAVAPEDTFFLFIDPNAVNTRHDLSPFVEAPNVRLIPATAGTFTVRQQTALPALARQHRLDLYHNPYYLVPYAMPCPMVATLHDMIPMLYPEAVPGAVLPTAFLMAVRLTVLRARRIIVVSQSTCRDLLRVVPSADGKVVAVHNAVDDGFAPQSEGRVAEVRRRYGLDARYLFYLGANKPHKNLVRLIEAWAMLPGEVRAGAELVVAGHEDERYQQVYEAVTRLGLCDVRMLGAVRDEDLAPLYSGATGFIFPSLYEGFGLPVLEAMACGAPVACSFTSSLPEIVANAALTFDPHNEADIAAAMRTLLEDAELRRELSDAGRQRAARFTWRRAAEETLAVYRSIETAR
ncbi:MAG TPA: glycosyltransferase family 4 protein [Chloroflexi bacterium]|jgi:glycosyltransferase involved in cell wall biosynthesis|nr:glycosyltransferase family 4 protein [Chloroflexota bacterium]